MKTVKPEPGEYAPFYETYIRLVPEAEILGWLDRQVRDTVELLRGVSESEAETRHAPYTWSVKEVVGHLTDAERVFGFRALCFAREDPAELPGFDENEYVLRASFDARNLADLAEEFEAVRRSNLALFHGLDRDAWLRGGVANGSRVTVRALVYIIAGHERHHVGILRNRLAVPDLL